MKEQWRVGSQMKMAEFTDDDELDFWCANIDEKTLCAADANIVKRDEIDKRECLSEIVPNDEIAIGEMSNATIDSNGVAKPRMKSELVEKNSGNIMERVVDPPKTIIKSEKFTNLERMNYRGAPIKAEQTIIKSEQFMNVEPSNYT